MKSRRVPRNRLSRKERGEQWDRIATEGERHTPRRLTGEKRARYIWLNLITRTELPSLTRLVAHTLALHGNEKGQKIYPSIRKIAEEAAISERSACTHVVNLVRSGWLQRERHRVHASEGSWEGVLYHFCVPLQAFLSQDNHDVLIPGWERAPGVERHSVPSDRPGVEPRSTPDSKRRRSASAEGAEAGAKGTEPGVPGIELGSEGVEPDVSKVLNVVQSRFPSEVPSKGSHKEDLTQGAEAPCVPSILRRVPAENRNPTRDEQLRRAQEIIDQRKAAQ